MEMLNPQYPPFIGAIALAASRSLDKDTHHAMLEKLKSSEC
jgi:hypothetical protein